MNTKALRQKVLDLAIHGKLVPQNPNDESATVLLEKIRAEKAEKIKKGELKADKKDSFIFTKECEFDEYKLGKCSSGTRHKRHYEQFADGTVKDIEDEIPFDIPEGWAWCRLPEITEYIFAGGDKPSVFSKEKTDECFIPIYSNGIENDGLYGFTDKATAKETSLTISARGTIGFTCIRTTAFVPIIRLITITPNNDYINIHYLKAVFDSLFSFSEGSSIPQLTVPTIKQFLIPLPPFNEQKNIYSSITKIETIIQTLEQNKNDLKISIKQTKSKILDLAIHGKLVPQDPNDEPAEELLKRIATSDNRPYEKIEEGDIPFEIPPSWKWTTIKNIVNYIGDGDWIESKDQSDKGIRLIQTGNIGFGTFKDKEGKYHYISENTFSSLGCNEIFEGDILISRLPEPVGRACILPKLPERMITAVDCTIIRLNEELFQKELFVYYTISNKYLELIKENCTGTTRLRISRSNLEKILVPIPPLNEQKRILNRIKELFEGLNEVVLNLV